MKNKAKHTLESLRAQAADGVATAKGALGAVGAVGHRAEGDVQGAEYAGLRNDYRLWAGPDASSPWALFHNVTAEYRSEVAPPRPTWRTACSKQEQLLATAAQQWVRERSVPKGFMLVMIGPESTNFSEPEVGYVADLGGRTVAACAEIGSVVQVGTVVDEFLRDHYAR